MAPPQVPERQWPRLNRPLPSVPEQELALANTRAELRHLQILQMKPSPAWKLDLLSQMERSARAEIKLRLKGIALTKQRCSDSGKAVDSF
jgi:hypothetical protein